MCIYGNRLLFIRRWKKKYTKTKPVLFCFLFLCTYDDDDDISLYLGTSQTTWNGQSIIPMLWNVHIHASSDIPTHLPLIRHQTKSSSQTTNEQFCPESVISNFIGISSYVSSLLLWMLFSHPTFFTHSFFLSFFIIGMAQLV